MVVVPETMGVVGKMPVLVEVRVAGGGVAVARLVVLKIAVVGLVVVGLGDAVVVGEIVFAVGVVVPVVVDEEDTSVVDGCTTRMPFVGAEVVLLNKVTS